MTDSSEPRRIQLRRTKGWRKPEGAIVVARPTKWGNPWRVMPWTDPPDGCVGPRGSHFVRGPGGRRTNPFATKAEATAAAVDLFRRWLARDHDRISTPWHDLSPLRGHDLACWCPLDQPCHADVLLELANPKSA